MQFKSVLLCLMLGVGSLAYAQSHIQFAVEATYPPFEFMNKQGKIEGFDIELAQAVCKNVNAECTFTHQAFSSLIPSLKLGKYDALISAIGITPERQEQVDFTNSYYEPSGSLVGAKARNITLTNLNNKSIGVQQGSTFENYLHDKYKNVDVKTYVSIQDAYLDLVAGRLELVLADTPIAQDWIKQNTKDYEILQPALKGKAYFGDGYAIAVKKNNHELLSQLNNGLEAIKKNGEYKKIFNKYFGT